MSKIKKKLLPKGIRSKRSKKGLNTKVLKKNQKIKIPKKEKGNANSFEEEWSEKRLILGEEENQPTENYDSEESDLDEEALQERHRKDLDKLKKTDPEFYKFLEDNDKKLLHFNLSDEEDAVLDETEDVDSVHKPTHDLEVASDESDFEGDDVKSGQKDNRVITLKIIKKWQSDIQADRSNKTIVEVTQAFHAALLRVSNIDMPDDESVRFKVEGSSIFNAVVQLCVMELGPAIRRYLGLQSGSKLLPHKCKKFNKVKGILKLYFSDLLKLLLGVTSSNVQCVLLKHLHYMSHMLASYSNITKSIVKKLISLWGSADDSVRVLAFLCILRITTTQTGGILDTTLKSMYLTFVKHSKFVSISSLALINFMKRSLVEMFSLDINISYTHVFLYIRQLAIQLRTAITVNKKENIQAVYNWQFINSLRLWGNLLSVTYKKQQMQQLVYPFVQVCLGTLKLVPTGQYFPLRFHVVQLLIDFSRDTGVFIPVLPFLLEILTSFDFNKKHQKLSMKPMHFTCLLRLSKSQLQENGFKDTVIDTVYGQILEYLSNQSNSIAFPDLSLVCIIHIKQFLKTCRVANYTRKMKQLLEKIEQNTKFIEDERSKVTFSLTDQNQIEGWESQIKVKGTPLTTYYESWNKLRNIKRNKEFTRNDQLGDYKLPTLNKVKKKATQKAEGRVELFPSDSDDSAHEGIKKFKRGKRGGKKNKKAFEEASADSDNQQDIVEDVNADDW
ncbi:nucleolar complex protein 2 homolog [Cylas formicarius]|uniref:nucleolar complex protein 2 homolog n=1 Tax=Cylas formicarius TaxID=197179 RepID=UPI002958C8A8|nr:nucleolar complex protein 2 homolog [Cylas formicarius]